MLTAAVWILAVTLPVSGDRTDVSPDMLHFLRWLEIFGRIAAATCLTIFING